MGLLRILNPLCGNAVAPRHRQTRALEEIARQGRVARPARPDRRGPVAKALDTKHAEQLRREFAAERAAKAAKHAARYDGQDARPFWERP
jgi:hypothetical protein